LSCIRSFILLMRVTRAMAFPQSAAFCLSAAKSQANDDLAVLRSPPREAHLVAERGTSQGHVLLSRQGAVVPAAAVDADCAPYRLRRDPDLDRLGAMGQALRHGRRHPLASRGSLAARQRADSTAREPLPARRSRYASAPDRLYLAWRRGGQIGGHGA